MKFRQLASYLEKLEATPSRNEMTQILSQLFRQTSEEEIDKVVYLASGQLAPSYMGIDFNIAEKLMMRIIAKAFNVELDEVKSQFKKKGDLGVVAEGFAKGKGGDASISEVYETLFEMARQGGGGSQERKIAQTAGLLSSLDPKSVRFVVRIPINNLRLGFSDMTILDALSYMEKGDKSARSEIEAAFNVTVDIGKIAKAVKQKGVAGLKGVQPEPGTPIRPSLAERLPSAEKILEKVGAKVIVEPKYDGFRAEVHIKNGEVIIFSRNLENTTSMFPDIVAAVKKIKVQSAIFDGEAIAYDAKSGKFLPFQETAQRKRKYKIEEAVKNLPLKLFVFDILYKNGKSLLALPFEQRRKILEDTIGDIDGVEITRQVVTGDPDVIRDLIKKYLSEGLEGALIKKIDAPYKAGARGYHWVKYKKTTEEGVADTIDCLVMGVNRGKGKRAGFGVGAFLVGIKDGNKFKSTSKIGTGLTDEQWRELDARSKSLEIKDRPKEYEVDKNLAPDAWTKPSLVVEILADEITKSPIHTAGLALRFPRLIRFRDEKGPQEATTLRELTKLFKMQKG
jgi:DNA ligase-1